MQGPAADKQHLLSVVLEDYFQVAPLRGVVKTEQWHLFENRVEVNTRKALDLLDEFDIKATFFVLGWIADEMPEVVREVAARGHEIASKGYYHHSLSQLSRAEFRYDLQRSRAALERATGTRVHGYRIAHGWFGPEDLWALDVLAEEGYAYDSSLRPMFRSFARDPSRRLPFQHTHGDATLWEYPLSTWSVGGWSFPIAGGNYLRQFPHALMKRAVARWHRTCEAPFGMYFHVWELDPGQPRIHAAPLLERIRQYRNLDKMPAIIRHYLSAYRFVGIGDYLGLARDPVTRDPVTRDPVTRDPVTHHPEASAAEAHQLATSRPRLSKTAMAPVPEASDPASATVRQPVPVPAPATVPVTVIVPCYNESESLHFLANTLRGVEASLEDRYDLRFVFVDDGSADGTPSLLAKLFGDRPNCAIVSHPTNRGVAAAILTGLRHADTEIVCSMDCDCTYDPHQLQSLIPMLKEDVDMVTASPYHPEGQVRNVQSWRLVLSRGLSMLYRFVLHHRFYTYTSCFRVYRRSAVVDLPVREGHFLGVVEMLALLDLTGGRLAECPAVLEVRLLGRAHMKVLRTIAGHVRLLGRMAWLRLRTPRPAVRREESEA